MARSIRSHRTVPDVGGRGAGRVVDESIGPAGDAFEREADRVADVVARGGRLGPTPAWTPLSGGAGAGGTLQRKCAECQEEEEEQIRRAPRDGGPELATPPREGPALGAGPAPAVAAPPAPASEAGGTRQADAAPAHLVDDEAETVRGQMRKSEFLAALRADICSAVDGALSGTGRDSQGCPWIEHWLGYYEGRSAAQIERAVRRYAPEAAQAGNARAYVRLVAARVRRSAETYAKTGEITGVPDDMPMGGGLLGAFGGMFFKARPGGPRAADPVSVRAQLGRGQPLDGGVRARMEPAFGRSFSGVEVHTDATGAALSERLNARAFTIGRHVAFGAGEFRPGTIAGDALIAHELAHVVQQGGATRPVAGRDGAAPLERDADRSALSAVSALWSGTRDSAARLRGQAAPALRSGLALRRCTSERQKEINRLGDVQHAFMEKRRKEAEEKARKEAEEDAKKKGLPPPPPPPKKEMADLAKEDAGKHSIPPSPSAEWDAIADKPKWHEYAKGVIKRVEASVKGTEVEPALADAKIVFTPEAAIKGGFYASFNSGTKQISVSMSWIKNADADPKNVWENLIHEGLAHRQYGETYSWQITMAALRHYSDAERKKIHGDPGTEKGKEQYQDFYEAYGYPETEIYAAVWQRRYLHPEKGPKPKTGGVDTDWNIVDKLKVMQAVLEPTVLLAVLRHLKRKIDENPQILTRDKKFYVDKVKEVVKIDL